MRWLQQGYPRRQYKITIMFGIYTLHGAVDNLSFARLVIHNAASKGWRWGSPFRARLPSPRHEWRGSNGLVAVCDNEKNLEMFPSIFRNRQDGDDMSVIGDTSYWHRQRRTWGLWVSNVSWHTEAVYIKNTANPEWVTCIHRFVHSAVESACLVLLSRLTIHKPVYCIIVIRT